MNWSVWMEEARERLKDARAALNSDRFSAACFWAQQAAELALKATHIVLHEEAPPKVHDLLTLANKVKAPASVKEAGAILNPAYIEARYIDVTSKAPSKTFDESDAQQFIESASKVVSWCMSQTK